MLTVPALASALAFVIVVHVCPDAARAGSTRCAEPDATATATTTTSSAFDDRICGESTRDRRRWPHGFQLRAAPTATHETHEAHEVSFKNNPSLLFVRRPIQHPGDELCRLFQIAFD